MWSMKTLRRLVVAGIGIFLVAAVTITNVKAGPAAKTMSEQFGDPVIAQIQAGKGRPQPVQKQWVSRWWNCKFHLVLTFYTPTEVDTPQGKSVVIVHGPETAGAIRAQLPERDPRCDNVSATQEQVDAMVKDVDARNAAERAAAGLPPIPLPTPRLEAVR